MPRISSKSSSPKPSNVPALLRQSGLKATKTRIAILDILHASHGPFSVQEIYQRLLKSRERPSCDVVTVYRALSRLEESDLVVRCDFGDNIARYEIVHGTHHHHHIVCTSCHRVDPVAECPVGKDWEKRIATGYKDVSHKLEFFGTCPACQSCLEPNPLLPTCH